ncbi:MAG: UDP-N-acetylmuramoyl-L-alanyl-D-glutamate--2,6-diaminopimelate ligase [Rhodospirillales bacterium]|nr:UDP-N-acetylmuramoyl-L-alanyl-D-glutamate--2,6-diaminopimelate ligase [Rhodospirillales bacterium]
MEGRARNDEREITGLALDSRRVEPGFLFAALPGSKQDGRDYIPQALARGAAAILAPNGTRLPDGAQAALITDANPRRRLARIAALFHGAQPKTVAAVTGTNGKTSTVHFLRQIWLGLGHRAASLGTLGLMAPDRSDPDSLTTPDPLTLHALLAELAQAGVTHLAMEASSHGLDQYRLDGVRFAAAAFTNLSRDHLDYHRDMETYRQAKRRLFTEVLAPGAVAVLNADSPEFERLAADCRSRHHHVIDYGRNALALRLVEAAPDGQDQTLTIEILGRRRHIRLPLVGGFQAMNALAALGLAIATGAKDEDALVVLAQLSGVPGRLQGAALRANGAAIYVDYAHTPDALETVLTALRPHAPGRLVVLFGCGGDRDPGKRPMMGAIAKRLADRVIVTDDNPRSEDPAAIRRQILAACPQAIEIGSRADAISQAVADLKAGDLLLVAGKGHEQGQIVGDRVLPFDDVREARRAVAEADA